MVVPGRRKSIAFFIALGVGLISVIILQYVGWVLFDWRSGVLLFLGVLLLALIISGVVAVLLDVALMVAADWLFTGVVVTGKVPVL